MINVKSCVFALIAGLATGCGTSVPDIKDVPGTPGQTQILVKAILDSIHCEIKNSVQYVISEDLKLAQFRPKHERAAPWFDDWGMAGLLTLTIAEKSELNPTVSWFPNPVTMLFSLGVGLDLSAEATRTDTLNFYYNVRDLAYKEKPCPVGPNGYHLDEHLPGSLLINSDLKLREWLTGQILYVATGATQLDVSKDKAVSHTISFEIISSADITPVWKLTHATVNSGGKLLSGRRDRTHELALTFGPANKEATTLAGLAQTEFQAQQFGASLSSRLRNLLTSP
ncbi:MAG: hypothetical protein WA709_21655 [Stellaceae bacterium]